MTSLEFIEKEIESRRVSFSFWEKQLKDYPNDKYFDKCLNTRKEELQNLQQIKFELEAWESVKELIRNSNGVYLLRVDSDDEDDKEHYIRIEKALELEDETK